MEELLFHTYRVFNDPEMGFLGNTSSVVLMTEPLPEPAMRRIAMDFCQPATTFLLQEDDHWSIRWFAPDAEIDVCGHGSMAAIAFLTNMEGDPSFLLKAPKFEVSGGKASENSGYIDLKAFPVLREVEVPEYLKKGLGIPIRGYFETANKNIVLTESEADVKEMKPDFGILRSSPTFGYVVTAPGVNVDFVSRTIVPHVQQLEDPATGSSHAALIPFWCKKLDKRALNCLQLSKRGGKFKGDFLDSHKVRLTGQYMKINSGTVAAY